MTFNGDGSYTYTPALNTFGSDSFVYELCDGIPSCDQAVVTITINSINDLPVANDDAVTIDEDTQWMGNVYMNDILGDGYNVWTIVSDVTAGTLDFYEDGSYIYTPEENFNTPNDGTVTFTYRLCDEDGDCSVATSTITISAVNDMPSFVGGENQTINEDSGEQTITVWATGIDDGDPDIDQVLSFNASNNNSGLFSTQPAISTDGTLTYTAASDAYGIATVTVTLTDDDLAGGLALTTTAQTFTLTINPMADAPTVTGATTNEDTQTNSGLVISRNVNDGAEVTHYKISNIQYGVLYQQDGTTIIPNNIFITAAQGIAGLRFTPSLNGTFNGSFEIQSSLSANDAGIDPISGKVTATITVTPVNDMPVFTKGEDQNVSENAGAQTLTGWATGIDDGDPEASQEMTFNVTNNNNDLFSVQPAIGSEGILTYTPAPGYTGIAQVTVTLTDDGTAGGSALTTASQLFTITVNDVTAPLQPSRPDLQLTSDSGVSGTDNVTNDNTPAFDISGVESLATVAVFANSISLGTIEVPFGYSSVSFIPSSPLADGPYVITATQTDEGDNTSGESAAMSPNLVIDTSIPGITLLGNNPMTINAGTPYNEPGATVTEGLTANISGTVQILIPGTYPITYNATDLAGNNAVEVTRTVNVVNTAPVITQGESISVSCSEDEVPTVFDLTLNATDAEGHLLTWSIESQPVHGTATASGTGTSKSIGYDPALNWYGTDVFVVSVSDGIAGGTDYITVNVTVDPMADIPFVTNATTNEDTQTNSGLVISRNTSDGAEVTYYRISNIQNGTVYLYNGVTSVANDSYITTAQGTAGLKFTPSLNSRVNGNFDIEADVDNISTNGLSGTVTATITLSAVNDAPINTYPGAQTVAEGATLVFSAGNSNAISVSDIDVAENVNGTLQIELTVSNGLLTLSQVIGLTFITGDGTSDAAITIRGLPANLNAALSGMQFTGYPEDFNGEALLTILTSDLGNTGSGGTKVDQDDISIDVIIIK